MAVLKCSICGGELDVNEDLSIGVCKFCDSTIVIPKNLDKKGNLYNRAVFLRQNSEFDKAASTYEDILKEDNSDAEAHWGLVLSKYGIEYVSDPRTGQHIPTCHRTQAASILSDPDYLAALEYADIEAQRVIEAEAKRISEIQARILEISRKEPPYDIFICYKESDEAGNRTEDSTLAQELYYELIKMNYKVFFARKTLESKLGTEYEPIIYAALNSAKVMIVLGTKAENFNAVWVRNEWSRFLKMSEDSQKTIIPAYRGMSPYELPIELSGLQSQDMSKIGFMQDLTDGIERCMRLSKKETVISDVNSQVTSTLVSLERLLQNGETYLKLNNFTEAEDIYKRITKEYPENYKGWWGRIICSTRSLSQASDEQGTVDIWYGYIKSLAPEGAFRELEAQYVDYLKLVAEVDAKAELDKVEGKKQTFKNELSLDRHQLAELESETLKMESDHAKAKQAKNERVSQCKTELARSEEAYEKFRSKAVFYRIGGVVSGIFVVWAAIDGIVNPSKAGVIINLMAWALLIAFAFIPINLFSKAADSGTYTRVIAKKKSDLGAAQDEVHKLEQDYTNTLQSHQYKVLQQTLLITETERKIAECDSYIENKFSALVQHFYSVRCGKIGVDIPFNEDISFSLADSSGREAEEVSAICPACGLIVFANRSETQQKGFIVCSFCGTEIKVD